MPKRPLPVTLVAGLLILSGAAGIVYHITDVQTWHPFPYGYIAILLTRVLAIVAGSYLLRGSEWARWLAMAWITVHVVISFYHAVGQLIIHCVVFVVFAYALFRPDAREYFQRATIAVNRR